MRRRPSVELVTLALLCVYLVHSTNFWLRVSIFRVQSDAEVVVLEDAPGAEEEKGNDLERRRAAIDPIKPIKLVTLEAVIEPARNASAGAAAARRCRACVGWGDAVHACTRCGWRNAVTRIASRLARSRCRAIAQAKLIKLMNCRCCKFVQISLLLVNSPIEVTLSGLG